MTAIDFLNQRRSVPSRLLQAPGPSAEQLQQILQTSVRVPDHGKLAPWRFLKIEGDARHKLCTLMEQRSRERDTNAAESSIEKDRLRFSYAPLIIVVIAQLTPDHKVPEQEQLLSGGALCFALLQAAQALGFGAQWLTGWPAYDPVMLQHFSIQTNEKILGFIHIGTASETAPERVRPEVAQLVTDWNA
jgi:nitroreductase